MEVPPRTSSKFSKLLKDWLLMDLSAAKWQTVFQHCYNVNLLTMSTMLKCSFCVTERTRPQDHLSDYSNKQTKKSPKCYFSKPPSYKRSLSFCINATCLPPGTLLLVFCAAFSCWLGQNPPLSMEKKSEMSLHST